MGPDLDFSRFFFLLTSTKCNVLLWNAHYIFPLVCFALIMPQSGELMSSNDSYWLKEQMNATVNMSVYFSEVWSRSQGAVFNFSMKTGSRGKAL